MDSKFRKPLFITVIAMIVITIFGIIVLLFNNQPQTESTTTENTNQTNEQQSTNIQVETDTMKITNLNTLAKNSDPQVKLDAQQTLYKYSTANIDQTGSITDAVVREGSFSQTDKGDGIYYDKMIVDIPTIKQSWGLVYMWSNSRSINGDYVFPLCLDESQLIYGNFLCQRNYGEYTKW